MPDFDTREPQGSNEPRRSRVRSIANRLSGLLRAGKLRILSTAGALRRLLAANRFLGLSVGWILLFALAVIAVGLLVRSLGWPDRPQQMGSRQEGSTIPGVQERRKTNIEIDEKLKSKLVFQLSGPYLTPSVATISTVNADGSGLEQLGLKQLTDTVDQTGTAYSSEDPARSPDLEKIAFTRLVTENLASGSASAGSAGPPSIQVPYVFVMNADGSDQVQLLDSPAAEPDWSPDGRQIVFSSDESWTLEGVTEDCDLYVASVDDPDTASRLTNGPGCERDPSWSPDGKKIAFANDPGANLDVYVIDACCEEGDANRPKQLTDDPLDDTDPAFSPDGEEIAFTRTTRASETAVDSYGVERPDETDVYKMDTDGSGETRLTYSKAIEAQPAFSPDGTKVAFTRQDFPGAAPQTGSMNATTGIFTMDSDGTDPTLVRIFETQKASSPEWGVMVPQDGAIEEADEGDATEEAITDWRALDARLPDVAVRTYIEHMKELLRGVNLHDNIIDGEENTATEITSSVLKGFGPAGRKKVVQYFVGTGLLPVIPLNSADLRSIDLSGTDLSGAQWSDVNLSGVDLSNTNLRKAVLYHADLSGADLSGADLSGAIVEVADLRNTNLNGAVLDGALMSGANLQGARVTTGQLARAEYLSGATMPDGTQHP